MHVASDRQILPSPRAPRSSRSPASPASLMREPLILRAQPGLCPSAEYFFAMIPTKWGAAGAVWKYKEHGASRTGFAERPTNALLCKIITPGLTIGELRHGVLKQYSLCDE